MVVGDFKQASKEFGATLGPILRRAKRKVESKEFRQVNEIVEERCLRSQEHFKVCYSLSLSFG